jgi:branched-chain amino acid transport system ATP-binding protein
MLRLENINTGYDKKQVLFDVSFEVQQGDIALLIGSNGSGKSTLLKAIFGLNKIWSGNIFFENEDITNAPSNTLLKKGLMYIPQKENCFDNLTVKENLEISGIALNDKILFEKRYENILEQFNVLKPLLQQNPMKLSGGERQMLTLAMALIHQPKLLLLDEPFTGLSPQAMNQTIETLKQINKSQNVTLLIVEHRLKEALVLASKLIGLKYGRIELNSEKSHKFEDKIIKEIFL